MTETGTAPAGKSDKKDFFGKDLAIVNIGVKAFYQELKDQGKNVCHVDWTPPAGGDARLLGLLDKLR